MSFLHYGMRDSPDPGWLHLTQKSVWVLLMSRDLGAGPWWSQGSALHTCSRGTACHLLASWWRRRCPPQWQIQLSDWQEQKGVGTQGESLWCCCSAQSSGSILAAPGRTLLWADTARLPAQRPSSCSDGLPLRSRPASWPLHHWCSPPAQRSLLASSAPEPQGSPPEQRCQRCWFCDSSLPWEECGCGNTPARCPPKPHQMWWWAHQQRTKAATHWCRL